MPRIPAPLRLMQEDWLKFKARMDYRMKPYLKQNKEITKWKNSIIIEY